MVRFLVGCVPGRGMWSKREGRSKKAREEGSWGKRGGGVLRGNG